MEVHVHDGLWILAAMRVWAMHVWAVSARKNVHDEQSPDIIGGDLSRLNRVSFRTAFDNHAKVFSGFLFHRLLNLALISLGISPGRGLPEVMPEMRPKRCLHRDSLGAQSLNSGAMFQGSKNAKPYECPSRRWEYSSIL